MNASPVLSINFPIPTQQPQIWARLGHPLAISASRAPDAEMGMGAAIWLHDARPQDPDRAWRGGGHAPAATLQGPDCGLVHGKAHPGGAKCRPAPKGPARAQLAAGEPGMGILSREGANMLGQKSAG